MKFHGYMVCAALAAFNLAGCTTPSGIAKQADGSVKTDTPKKKLLRRVIEQPATVEAFEETPLLARIPGYVAKVAKDIGDEVKRGETLAEISVPELIQEHAQKKALVVQSKAEVEQAKAQVGEADAAIARVDAQTERWEGEYARVEGLYKNKVVEKQILDETLFQLKAAKASQQEAKAKKNKANADVAAANARVLVAEADEGRVKALADYRWIVAPFQGVVTRRNIHTGSFLQPNASGGPGVLFVVARVDTLRIIAEVPEADARYITDKLKLKIQVPALKGEAFDGEVARTSRTLDAKSRTLRVEIDHANKGDKLRPGMFANLIISVDLPDLYTLPANAVFTHADQPCCWRVVEGKAVRTMLKVAMRDSQFVQVLDMKAGDGPWHAITGTEEVAVTNLGAIAEGKEVRVDRK